MRLLHLAILLVLVTGCSDTEPSTDTGTIDDQGGGDVGVDVGLDTGGGGDVGAGGDVGDGLDVGDGRDVGGDAGGSTDSVSAVITAAGGQLTLGEVTVDIPSGALSEDTEITARVVTESSLPGLPSDLTAIGPAIALLPHGQIFSQPVTVTIPYTSAAPIAQLSVQRLDDEADSTWEEQGGASFAAGTATVSTTTFSVLWPTEGPEVGWANLTLESCLDDDGCDLPTLINAGQEVCEFAVSQAGGDGAGARGLWTELGGFTLGSNSTVGWSCLSADLTENDCGTLCPAAGFGTSNFVPDQGCACGTPLAALGTSGDAVRELACDGPAFATDITVGRQKVEGADQFVTRVEVVCRNGTQPGPEADCISALALANTEFGTSLTNAEITAVGCYLTDL